MATYNVHGGHSLKCRGASGCLDEVNEDRAVKNRVIELLRVAGHTVYDCTDDVGTTQNQNLKNIVAKCNQHAVDLDISIHLNSARNDYAGDGVTGGVEVYNYSSKTAAVSDRICQNISNALGLTNRGTKYTKGLYVLNHTHSPAILIECCFVDDKDDADRWNVDVCAKAIAEGILGTTILGSSSSSTPQPTSVPTSSQNSSDDIAVDGKWGKDTTRKAQKVFGTAVDGIVSRQKYSCKKYLLNAYTSSWEFKTSNFGNGSPLIRAIQSTIGAKEDGFFGPNSVYRLQVFLGVPADKKMGPNTVKAFQRWLNAR